MSSAARRLHGQVCEFHYLQHRPDGRAYDDPLELSWALADAAADTGLGLTLLPVLYERAGFAHPDTLRDDQRRFAADAAAVARLAAGPRRAPAARRRGPAIHSLRAAAPASIHALHRRLTATTARCTSTSPSRSARSPTALKATGARPIDWLVRQGVLDARWQLVHATHAEPHEIESVARSGAGVVICPATEANLGDGLTDLPLAGAGRADGDRLGQPGHAQLGRGAALARVRAAPRAAPAQRLRRSGRAVGDGGAPLRRRARRERRAGGLPRWGLVAARVPTFLVLDAHDPSLPACPPATSPRCARLHEPGR